MTSTDPEDFHAAVRSDMFGEPLAWLRTPEVVSQWIAELTSVINGVAEQMSEAKTADLLDREESIAGDISRSEYAQRMKERGAWRKRASVVKRHALTRLEEAKEIRTQRNFEQSQQIANDLRWAYREAIKAHRDASMSADVEPEPHDLALWAVLDITREQTLASYGSELAATS